MVEVANSNVGTSSVKEVVVTLDIVGTATDSDIETVTAVGLADAVEVYVLLSFELLAVVLTTVGWAVVLPKDRLNL